MNIRPPSSHRAEPLLLRRIGEFVGPCLPASAHRTTPFHPIHLFVPEAKGESGDNHSPRIHGVGHRLLFQVRLTMQKA